MPVLAPCRSVPRSRLKTGLGPANSSQAAEVHRVPPPSPAGAKRPPVRRSGSIGSRTSRSPSIRRGAGPLVGDRVGQRPGLRLQLSASVRGAAAAGDLSGQDERTATSTPRPCPIRPDWCGSGHWIPGVQPLRHQPVHGSRGLGPLTVAYDGSGQTGRSSNRDPAARRLPP